MAVVVKTSKLATLMQLGYQVASLQAAGVTMQVGIKVLKFYAHNGDLISTVDLSVPYSQLLEDFKAGNTGAHAHNLLAIGAALKGLQVATDKPIIKTHQAFAPGTAAAMMSTHKPGDLATKKEDPEPVSESDVVLLRDATKLHQRVQGTSPDSIYVVVGVGLSHAVQVAARIKDTGMKTTLSVRVEGILTQGLIEVLTKNHGMTAHSKKEDGVVSYLSGHYHCVPGVTPEKVLGSILLGSGIEFKTGMPNMGIVRKLGV